MFFHTDSQYSIDVYSSWIKDWIKHNWKTSSGKQVKNQDIIQKTYAIICNHKGDIKFKHVRSHTGKKDADSLANDIVDKLAKDGANKS